MDSSVLLYLVYPDAPAPIDPATGVEVSEPFVRIEGLLEGLDSRESVIIVPTPVLSELLIRAEGRQPEVLAAITGRRAVEIAPFDVQAAVENAALRRTQKRAGGRTSQAKNEVRFDLQILAIARARGAQIMYTDDASLRSRCAVEKMVVRGIADLPIPESKRQIAMALPSRADNETKPERPSPGA